MAAKNGISRNLWQNMEQCGEFANQLPKRDTEKVIVFETPPREHAFNQQFYHIRWINPNPLALLHMVLSIHYFYYCDSMASSLQHKVFYKVVPFLSSNFI